MDAWRVNQKRAEPVRGNFGSPNATQNTYIVVESAKWPQGWKVPDFQTGQKNVRNRRPKPGTRAGPVSIRTITLPLGEQLIHDVYYALRNAPAWNQTLLIVTYDERGGCYDHVPPP
jgi:hypothetical protein